MPEITESNPEKHNLDALVAMLMQGLSSEASFRNLIQRLDAFHWGHIPDEVWDDTESAMKKMDEGGEAPWQTSEGNPKLAEDRQQLLATFGLPADLSDDEILQLEEKLSTKAKELGFSIS